MRSLNKYERLNINMRKHQLAMNYVLTIDELTNFYSSTDIPTLHLHPHSHCVPHLFVSIYPSSTFPSLFYNTLSRCPHFSSSNILTLSLLYWYLCPLSLSPSPLILSSLSPLCLLLCHSRHPLFMAQSQSELKDRAISLRQRRSRSSRIGSWETGSPPRSGRVCGGCSGGR